MAKDRVFELIRKEELILFVGAGMSLYAGYPSGEMLCKILFDNLTEDLKKEVDSNMNLPKLSEEIYNLKGGNKNYLFQILKKEFQKEPTSVETHKLLSKIPHFKTIITTNYDNLIESTNKEIEVIRKSIDYPLANFKKQLLFKIHSDLSDTENIILTNSDYNNYFSSSKEKTVFWNAVKDKLASNHILFIGYSMDDPNINVIIGNIIKELGDNRKEMFFVSPSISISKLNFLQRNGIEYIESTGEILIKEIYEDLKLNYFPNLSKGDGTSDTALSFANSHQINIEVSKRNEVLQVNGINSYIEDKNYQIKVRFELPKEQAKQINDSLNGQNFEDIKLGREEVKEFGYFLKGIRLKNESNIQSLIFKKAPIFDCNIEIIFEDGFEIDNYKFKLYVIHPDKNESHLKIEVEDFTIILKISDKDSENNNQIKIEIVPDEQIKSTNSGLKFYEILYRIVSNQNFKIYKDGAVFYDNSFVIKFGDDALDAKLLLFYFQSLKKIERHFDIRFTKINFNNVNVKLIEKIIAYIDKTEIIEHFEGLIFKNENKDEFEYLINFGDEDRVMVMCENVKTIIKLHEIEFDLGYLHRIINDVFIENLEDLKTNKTEQIKLKSKTNSICIHFSDDATMLVK